MQITETRIAREQDGFSEFLMKGQGGETVSVVLKSRPAETVEDFVDRARAILVQAATFDRPEEKAAPEPIRPETPSTPSRTYILEYVDSGELRTTPPSDLASLDTVEREVMASATDLWIDALSRQEAPTGWAVRARDERGNIVASVNFEDVQRALSEAQPNS